MDIVSGFLIFCLLVFALGYINYDSSNNKHCEKNNSSFGTAYERGHYTRNNSSFGTTYVRGHYRRNKYGGTTYVRAHRRRR